jgi:hypothetical protein
MKGVVVGGGVAGLGAIRVPPPVVVSFFLDRPLAFLRSADARPGISFCGDHPSDGYLDPALWSGERAVARIGA